MSEYRANNKPKASKRLRAAIARGYEQGELQKRQKMLLSLSLFVLWFTALSTARVLSENTPLQGPWAWGIVESLSFVSAILLMVFCIRYALSKARDLHRIREERKGRLDEAFRLLEADELAQSIRVRTIPLGDRPRIRSIEVSFYEHPSWVLDVFDQREGELLLEELEALFPAVGLEEHGAGTVGIAPGKAAGRIPKGEREW